ncbi:hypothetical protein LTR09_012801 [Extremus antarcticus]|uniref:Metallo-beta-lactamase domain-containing protein n=1 Tax=Extremus antarcticus TaxID=702011 RepID=A0AAJ0D4H3_9PEZI|nr:hypothetical protein LTR09_012801 [Extremus antarcticus]
MDDIHQMKDGSSTVAVSALPTGQLAHPDRWLFEDGDENLMQARQLYPVYSFLIEHPSGRKILFDLGLPKDLETVPPAIRRVFDIITPKIPKDASQVLSAGSVSATSIDSVILSHLHFDHVGDCTKFPEAVILAGQGSKTASAPGWPVQPSSPFSSAVLQHPRFRELDDQLDNATSVGPFAKAYDYFGDRSFFLVEAPGHMPGHIGALAFTGENEWIFMGGDCCHHRSLLVGSRPMSITCGPAGREGFHKDPGNANATIEKVRTLEQTGHVLVALSHDSFLCDIMPEYPQRLNGWKASTWKARLDKVLSETYPAMRSNAKV